MLHVVTWAWAQKCGNPLEKLILLRLSDSVNMDSLVCAHFGDLAEFCSAIETDVIAALKALERSGHITTRDWLDHACMVMLPWDMFRRFHEVPKRRQLTRRLRDEIVTAFGGVCEYCKGYGGKDLGPDGRNWNIEHMISRSRGGSDEDENLTLACEACNRNKRSRPAPAGTRSLAYMKAAR